MNRPIGLLETATDEAAKHHYAFCLPDGTWCIYKTVETNLVKIYNKICRDGYNAMVLIPLKTYQEGRWEEFKKTYLNQQ